MGPRAEENSGGGLLLFHRNYLAVTKENCIFANRSIT